jgi:hypothetical protein
VRRFIERDEFMGLYEDIAKFACEREKEIADGYFVRKLEGVLGEMGYDLLTDGLQEEGRGDGSGFSMRPGEVRYLESPYDGYRVMIKAGSDGSLTARLVRTVASERERDAAGEDQRQKDIEAGQKWCRDFDGFLEKMRGLGLPLDVTVRREPEEVPVLAVVDKSRPVKRRRKSRENAPSERALGEYEDGAR